jgi:hypothetical protein
MGVIYLSLLCFIGASSAYSDGGSQDHVLNTPLGPQHFTVHRGTNLNGELEVQIEHEESRKFVPGKTSNTVIYGRDLDNDGKIDAWFYVDDNGFIESADTLGSSDDEWTQAASVILKHKEYQNRWLTQVLLNRILSHLTITVAQSNEAVINLVEQEINAQDLDVRVARLAKLNPKNPDLGFYYLLSSDTWADISEEAAHIRKTQFIDEAVDEALLAGGWVLGKGISALSDFLLPKFLSSAPGMWAADVFDGLRKSIAERAALAGKTLFEKAQDLGWDSDRLEAFKETIRWPAIVGAEQGIKRVLTEQLPAVVKGLNERSKIAAILAKAFTPVKAAGAAAIHWSKYIAATETAQLGVEAYNRRDELFSHDPIISSKSRKELIQDMGFGAVEAFTQTGVAAADPNVKRRMVIAAFVSLGDSKVVNYFVNDKNPDPGRNTLDVGWEIIPANIETQIDVTALNGFEKMALKTDNPKLVLVGYAIALTDDAIGSYAYEKASARYYKDKAAGTPMFHWLPSWIPVFGQK